MDHKGKGAPCGASSDCCRTVDGGVRESAAADSVSPGNCTACNVASTRYEKPKMCRCGKGRCKILTSTKDHSRGQKFYCCPQSTGANNHGCGMFEWVTDAEGGSSSLSSGSKAEMDPKSTSGNMLHSPSSYARGYLDGAIRGSEQQTIALKNVLDALKKMDLHPE